MQVNGSTDIRGSEARQLGDQVIHLVISVVGAGSLEEVRSLRERLGWEAASTPSTSLSRSSAMSSSLRSSLTGTGSFLFFLADFPWPLLRRGFGLEVDIYVLTMAEKGLVLWINCS